MENNNNNVRKYYQHYPTNELNLVEREIRKKHNKHSYLIYHLNNSNSVEKLVHYFLKIYQANVKVKWNITQKTYINIQKKFCTLINTKILNDLNAKDKKFSELINFIKNPSLNSTKNRVKFFEEIRKFCDLYNLYFVQNENKVLINNVDLTDVDLIDVDLTADINSEEHRNQEPNNEFVFCQYQPQFNQYQPQFNQYQPCSTEKLNPVEREIRKKNNKHSNLIRKINNVVSVEKFVYFFLKIYEATMKDKWNITIKTFRVMKNKILYLVKVDLFNLDGKDKKFSELINFIKNSSLDSAENRVKFFEEIRKFCDLYNLYFVQNENKVLINNDVLKDLDLRDVDLSNIDLSNIDLPDNDLSNLTAYIESNNTNLTADINSEESPNQNPSNEFAFYQCDQCQSEESPNQNPSNEFAFCQCDKCQFFQLQHNTLPSIASFFYQPNISQSQNVLGD